MKENIEKLKNDYGNYLLLHGYVEDESVEISSGVDHSVVLVGSTISVLKSKLLNHNVNKNGEFLFQRAIRTRGIKRLLIPEKIEWYSYFDASGILVNYNKIDKLVYDVIEFINKNMNFSYSDIMIRVSKEDIDLMNSLKNIDNKVVIETDSRDPSYYKHKYGLEKFGIYGRNLNIALKNYTNSEYQDIGNIIVIESAFEKYGVECAIGINALLMRRYALQNSIEASSIVDIYNPSDSADYKFLDCLTVVSHLAYENIIQNTKRSPQYIYRKYLNALKYWADLKNMSNKALLNLINEYIKLEYSKCDEQKIENNVNKLLLRRRF